MLFRSVGAVARGAVHSLRCVCAAESAREVCGRRGGRGRGVDQQRGERGRARERGLRERWDHLRTNALPQEPSQAEQRLLRACDEWAKSSGAQIVDRMPQWKGDETAYQVLRCRLETSGSLSSLTQFLQRLEEGPLAVKLDSLQLVSRDPSGRQMTLGLQINGLVLNPPAKP